MTVPDAREEPSDAPAALSPAPSKEDAVTDSLKVPSPPSAEECERLAVVMGARARVEWDHAKRLNGEGRGRDAQRGHLAFSKDLEAAAALLRSLPVLVQRAEQAERELMEAQKALERLQRPPWGGIR